MTGEERSEFDAALGSGVRGDNTAALVAFNEVELRGRGSR